jgi:hypothetical protein
MAGSIFLADSIAAYVSRILSSEAQMADRKGIAVQLREPGPAGD